MFTSLISFCELTIFSIKLHGKPSWIPNSIRRAGLSTNRRKSYGHIGFFSNFWENYSGTVFGDVVCDFEVAESTATLCMYNPLRDSFAIKMGYLFDVVDVMEEDRSAWANSLTVVKIDTGYTLSTSCVRFFFILKKNDEERPLGR